MPLFCFSKIFCLSIKGPDFNKNGSQCQSSSGLCSVNTFPIFEQIQGDEKWKR